MKTSEHVCTGSWVHFTTIIGTGSWGAFATVICTDSWAHFRQLSVQVVGCIL
jgi:hypothetical protein